MNGREFRGVSDEELEMRLGKLLGAGARLEARIVAHLAELEERRLHLLAGYSSLYDYCRKRLALSDYEAFARIAAARAARKYPMIFEMLEQRRLHLTAICEVREFLTAENHRELLEEVSGQTKPQIREILARRFPQADLRASVKKLPELDPLSPGRYRLLLTLSAEQKEKLELARALLSHANPTGDLSVVVERALDTLIAQLEKRRFGGREARGSSDGTKPTQAKPKEVKSTAAELNEKRPVGTRPNIAKLTKPKPIDVADQTAVRQKLARPRIEANAPQSIELNAAERPSRRRKHIRNVVRRELVARDGARCSFIGVDGTCCQERSFLQLHHRYPWARGGADTPENLAWLCQAHNRLLAEQDFGKAHIQKTIDNCNSLRSHEPTPHLGQPRSEQ